MNEILLVAAATAFVGGLLALVLIRVSPEPAKDRHAETDAPAEATPATVRVEDPIAGLSCHIKGVR